MKLLVFQWKDSFELENLLFKVKSFIAIHLFSDILKIRIS